jgi:deoxyribonuclease V
LQKAWLKETGKRCQMKIQKLHEWDAAGYHDAVRIQERLKSDLILRDTVHGEIGVVAGGDISYSRGDDRFFAAVVSLRLPDFEVLEETRAFGHVRFPYIPGLLSFREAPILLQAFEKLQRLPDVVLIDGQGIAHPRGFGLASHVGLFLDVPTIGCAKTRLVGTHEEVGPEAGDYSELLLEGQVVGAVLRTKKNVKPLYVSQGHRIDLQGAVDAVRRCLAGYRIPEPLRRAHHAVNAFRRGASS